MSYGGNANKSLSAIFSHGRVVCHSCVFLGPFYGNHCAGLSVGSNQRVGASTVGLFILLCFFLRKELHSTLSLNSLNR